MGGGSHSESLTGSAQKWATPIATSAANGVTAVQNLNQPKIQGMADQITGTLVPGLMSQYQAGNPNVKAAQGYNADVLGGKYLHGNPYLQSQIDQMRRGVTDQVDSQFATAGRYGSGAYTDLLSRNLADAENNLRYNDYNNQMTRMDNAAQQAPTLAQSNYIGLPEILQSMGAGASLPYTGTTASSNALSALFNGGTQIENKSNGIGGILQGAGALASGAAMFSDRRLKQDIVKLGQFDDGLGHYEWQYVWGGQRHRGVMADEVATLRPWALGPVVDGYATVDYSKLEAR